MPLPFDNSLIAPVAIGALVTWRIYARARRVIGRQRLSSVRPWITIFLFPLVLLALLAGALFHPLNAAALLLGALIGVGLGRYGTRLTKFEATPAGLFYTPNAHLGIALSLLLVLRIGYRFMRLHLEGQGVDLHSMQTNGSPLTLGIFGTLGGYYVTYAIGLLRWRASVRPEMVALAASVATVERQEG
jgi:hypothetical protein